MYRDALQASPIGPSWLSGTPSSGYDVWSKVVAMGLTLYYLQAWARLKLAADLDRRAMHNAGSPSVGLSS
jgi:hypothetical protein